MKKEKLLSKRMKKEKMLKRLLNGYKKRLLNVVTGNLRQEEIR